MNDSPPPSPETPQGPPPPPPPPAIKPVQLPKPDGFGDINQATQVHRAKARTGKRRWWSRKSREPAYRHPTDVYANQPPARKRGCGSCLLSLVALALLPLAGAGIWLKGVKRDLTGESGFAWVAVKGRHVTAAPAAKTAHFGWNVLYEPKATPVETAFVGGSWWIGGTFQEKVTFRGARLVIEPGSRFLKGLDVQALELDAGGARIDGELSGRIWSQR